MFSVYMYMVMFFRIIFRQQRSHQAVQGTTSLALCLQLYRCYRPLWFTSPPVRLYDQLYLTSFTIAVILFQASNYLNITWTLDCAKDPLSHSCQVIWLQVQSIIPDHCRAQSVFTPWFSNQCRFLLWKRVFHQRINCTILHIVCNWCMQIGV